MKSILITGASGFIGSFLVEEAIKKNYKVYAGIRNTSSRKYLQHPEINFIELDFSSSESLRQTLTKHAEVNGRFDFIVHGAGVTKVSNNADFYNVNVQNTKHFTDALIAAGMIPEKFILISSLAAYGPKEYAFEDALNLTDTPQPVSEYGKSKLQAEQHIKSLEKFPYMIIRPTAVYGPRDKDMFQVFKLLNSGFELYVGKRNQHFSFIYVKDLVRIILLAAETSHINKSYFASDGNAYERFDLSNTIKKQLNKKSVRIFIPHVLLKGWVTITDSILNALGKTNALNADKLHELAATNWKCNTETLSTELNFKAEYNLTEGVKETFEWYKKEKWF